MDATVKSEIERKFRVASPPSWLSECVAEEVRQGYLIIGADVEIRLRAIGERRVLTVKRGHGEVRDEVEVEISREQFDALWPLTDGRRLAKRRRRVSLDEGGLVADVDTYESELEGLVVAEVEFESESEADVFEPPSWLGTEITGDERFANQSLARDGLPGDQPG